MVEHGETTVTVDEQGRLVLPSRLRQKLGIKKGGKLSIRIESPNKIVMERRADDSVRVRVRAWTKLALSEKGEAGVADRSGKKSISTKWMSSEYARRKLGL